MHAKLVLLALGALLALVMLGFRFGLLPPLNTVTLIRIRDGVPYARKGLLQSDAREHLCEIFHEAGIARGFIAITTRNRVAFSWRIPSAIHQRVRNVLLNQWP